MRASKGEGQHGRLVTYGVREYEWGKDLASKDNNPWMNWLDLAEISVISEQKTAV